MQRGGLIIVVGVICLLSGGLDAALAWGPGVHIGLGSGILENVGLLPASVAALLAKNAIAYLYGNIAADVVFAKKMSRVKQFCHHWTTGFRLLEQAETDRAKAFALGYLSHLAADTVAHGKFVPRQLALCDCSMNFGHFYWELRADASEDTTTWNLFRELIQQDHEEHHDLLEAHLTETLLSYDLNRALFERMNAFASRPSVVRTIDLWGRLSRWELSYSLLRGYQSESLDRIIAILSEGQRCAVIREDPNGASAIQRASLERKSIREMRRSGVSIEHRLREIASSFAPSSNVPSARMVASCAA